MDNYCLYLYISWNIHGIWNGNDDGLALMGGINGKCIICEVFYGFHGGFTFW